MVDGVGGNHRKRKTPLIFVEKGAKINTKFYHNKILKGVLNSWTRQHFGKNYWTLQQDSVPAHSADFIMVLCKKVFLEMWDKDMWPANSSP